MQKFKLATLNVLFYTRSGAKCTYDSSSSIIKTFSASFSWIMIKKFMCMTMINLLYSSSISKSHCVCHSFVDFPLSGPPCPALVGYATGLDRIQLYTRVVKNKQKKKKTDPCFPGLVSSFPLQESKMSAKLPTWANLRMLALRWWKKWWNFVKHSKGSFFLFVSLFLFLFCFVLFFGGMEYVPGSIPVA